MLSGASAFDLEESYRFSSVDLLSSVDLPSACFGSKLMLEPFKKYG